jgi:hypothetical protein
LLTHILPLNQQSKTIRLQASQSELFIFVTLQDNIVLITIVKLILSHIYLLIFLFVSCKKQEEITSPNYSVSGRVTNQQGLGLSSVTIYFNATDYVITNADGYWSVTNLTGTHIISPQKDNYNFTPNTFTVNKATSDILFLANNINGNTISNNEQKIIAWLNNLQLSNGLLESTDNSNMVSLYDNALAALAFMSYQDFARAEKIFDFFNARITNELLSGNGGFSQFRDRNGNPDGKRWMGDNAWLLLALNNYKALTGSTKYNNLSSKIENWIRSLQDATDGGIWGGYNSTGVLTGKVTEGNIDAFVAVPKYDNFHVKILNYLKNNRLSTTEKILVSWPGNSQYLYALDIHPWGYCSFEDFPATVLTKANRFICTQTATATQQQITGYCFDIDKDDIWLEGTGEMVVAFRSAGLNQEADNYLNELDKTIINNVPINGVAGMPYATNIGTGYGNGLLWQGADTKPAISSSVWYLFAKHQFNPFSVVRIKNIPLADKFWLK